MDCKTSSLCIFDKPGILTDIQRTYTVDYYPVSSVSSNAPIEFFIPGNGEDYIDINETKLYVRLKVTKADGSAINQTDDVVGLTNLPICSLFQDVMLMIGDNQIEGGDMSYPLRSYLRTLFQFDPDAQNTHMQAFGWYKDEAGKFDDKTNSGFVKRQKLVGSSNVIELYGPLYLDFFNQDRYLISQTDMRLKLMPNKPEHALLSFTTKATDFKINFESIILYVDRAELNPSVINGHAMGLKSDNARYFINHTELLNYTIPAGQKSYTKDRLFPDLAPKMILIAMTENEAFNGAYGKNPFRFQHFNLNKLALYREGRSIPGHPFQPDFAKSIYLRDYIHTMRAFDYYNTDQTNGLTPEEWANGYTVYAFDLTADKDVSTSCLQGNLAKNLRLELNFSKNLAKTINVIIYAVTDSQVEITQLRDVITHYNR